MRAQHAYAARLNDLSGLSPNFREPRLDIKRVVPDL
jgi:hypothetical protein